MFRRGRPGVRFDPGIGGIAWTSERRILDLEGLITPAADGGPDTMVVYKTPWTRQ